MSNDLIIDIYFTSSQVLSLSLRNEPNSYEDTLTQTTTILLMVSYSCHDSLHTLFYFTLTLENRLQAAWLQYVITQSREINLLKGEKALLGQRDYPIYYFAGSD